MRKFPRYSGSLSTAEAAEFVPFIRRLAQSAMEEIRPHHLNETAVETKDDATPVTVADRRAEALMREAITASYPDHGILGEEYGEYQPSARYQWVLDPIDGTKSFVTGSFLFGTLIALVRDERPILGAIAHPLTGHLLIGDGNNAELAGKPVRVRAVRRIEEAVLLTTDHWLAHERSAGFAQLSRGVKLYRTWGDCHGYFLVATGGADIMLDPVMAVWDLMALIPIIEGAGGRVTDWRGDDPVGANSMIATNGLLHEAVLTALS